LLQRVNDEGYLMGRWPKNYLSRYRKKNVSRKQRYKQSTSEVYKSLRGRTAGKQGCGKDVPRWTFWRMERRKEKQWGESRVEMGEPKGEGGVEKLRVKRGARGWWERWEWRSREQQKKLELSVGAGARRNFLGQGGGSSCVAGILLLCCTGKSDL